MRHLLPESRRREAILKQKEESVLREVGAEPERKVSQFWEKQRTLGNHSKDLLVGDILNGKGVSLSKSGYSFFGESTSRELRDANAIEFSEAIKEVDEVWKQETRASLREGALGIVFGDKLVPFGIEMGQGEELFLCCEESGNNGDLKLSEWLKERSVFGLFFSGGECRGGNTLFAGRGLHSYWFIISLIKSMDIDSLRILSKII